MAFHVFLIEYRVMYVTSGTYSVRQHTIHTVITGTYLIELREANRENNHALCVYVV